MAINQLNVVVMEGNLVADPETREVAIKETGEVKPAASFRIANNRIRRSGEHVNFFDVEVFGQSAAFVRDYCRKGDTVIVEAENEQDRWEDESGQKRAKVLLRGKTVQKRRSAGGSAPAEDSAGSAAAEDDIPF